jgi:hypothetical chaperone protein
VRTLLYLTRGGEALIGQEAADRFHRDNANRLVRLTRRVIGYIDTPEGVAPVTIFEDEDRRGRLIHSLKSSLATPYQGTDVFGAYWRLEEMIARYLSVLRERAAAHLGEAPRRAVFGRPVHFAGGGGRDASAQDRLEEAARLAGFEETAFEYEPIAASLALSPEGALPADQHVLVFDFGGGTLDIAAVRAGRAGALDVLAVDGLGSAGDDFDRALFKHKVLGWLGRDVTYGDKRLKLSNTLLETLSEWEDIYGLYNPETIDHLREVQQTGSSAAQVWRLEELITRGHGYRLFSAIERSKVELSDTLFSVIEFQVQAGDHAKLDIWQPVTRRQFEQIIAEQRQRIERLVLEVVSRAALEPRDVDAVLPTGGSSGIPCFLAMLHRLFPEARFVEANMFTSVAAGLAVRASQVFGKG